MKKEIWIEWIGLWGSGKTKCINDLSDSLLQYDCTINSSQSFFVKSKYTKICKLLKSFPRTLALLLRFLFIFIPIYISAKINNNVIVRKELRSFLSCYLARISLVNIENIDITLWEGEFHILPMLEVSNQVMGKIVDHLLQVNQTKETAFVFLKVDIETAKFRILKDQKDKKNIRFSEEQTDLCLDFLPKFNANQNNLINCLKERGCTVHESAGTLDDISDFLRGLSQDIF